MDGPKGKARSLQAVVNRAMSTSAQNSAFEYAMVTHHRTDRGSYR